MNKRLTKILSCLICLTMLWSMVAPVAAATGTNSFEEITFAPDLNLPDEDEALSLEAPAADGDAALSQLPGGATMSGPAEAELLASNDQVTSIPETVPINRYDGSDCSILFDANWKFNLGDLTGAQNEVYNDASWGTVDLPHDFSIDQEYSSAYEGESGYLPGGVGWYRKSFMVDPSWENKVVTIHFGGAYMDTVVYLNGTKLGENHYGYNPFDFVLPADLLHYSGENVLAVRVTNSIPSSRWYSGSGIYRSVYLNVSDQVHVDRYGVTITTQNSGAVTVKTAVRNDGASSASNVTVKQEIYELDGATFEKKGAAVAENTSSTLTVANSAANTATQNLTVSNPKLWYSWDKGTPNLYLLVTSVLVNGTVVDTHETEFGFREMVYDVDRGCSINGTYIKFKGVCQHHDQGGLGAEAWYRALERQVDILMEMGCNSIRVTHNPAADELLEICNRKGILVIDEVFDMWMNTKNGNANDFARWFNVNLAADNQIMGGSSSKTWAQFVLETICLRDKNDPCVIMYSLGNEINTVCSGPTSGYAPKSLELIAWAKAADPTRPVTLGDNGQATDSNSWQGQINNNIFNNGGVVGHNYPAEGSVTRAHNNRWPIYASETVSAINSRGIYKNKTTGDAQTATKRLSSYDQPHVSWGYTAAEGWWRTVRYDYNMGEYVWTGFDYIGEPTPWNGISAGAQSAWPSPKNSFFGIIDTNGIPKDSYYLYRAMWNDTDTTLHLLPTWDRDDIQLDSNGRVEVVVYSNAPVIRLYLNGKEVGAAKSTDNYAGASRHVYRTFTSTSMKESGTNTFSAGSGKNSLYSTFWVPYTEGTLEVKAFANESTTTPMTDTVGRSVVNTTTGAAKLSMSADRTVIKNDGRDLTYITIDVLDENDEIVNGAEPEITVSVSGDGKFMALDNGIQPDHTPYSSTTRTAGAGRLVAIVQSTKQEGSFTVTATSNGLTSDQVTVTTRGAETTVSDNVPVSYTIAKTYYVRLGVAPTLPGSVTVTLGDGTSTTENVSWNSYDSDLLNTVGNEFAISGTISSYDVPISVSVVVLDEVAALLNYSAAAQVGTTPLLPDTRPAVMADGTVLTAQFPVNWTMPSAKTFNKAGIVTIPGTAQVFGKTLNVTAKIRMDEGSIILGSDVSGIADTLTMNGTPDDSLQAIRDDSLNTTWRGSGEPVFYFNTAIGLYQVKVTYAGSVPSGGLTISTSPNANLATAEWTTQEATRTVSGSTVTYQLAKPGSAILTKLSFAQEVEVAEVELVVASVAFSQNSTADLDGLKVNGTLATSDQLAAKIVRTSDATAVVEPVSSRNVASTILPADNNGRILIITESEDHSTRSLYTVYVDYHELDAADSSNDYPYNKTTATAPSQANNGNDGPASNAADGDENTFWHSRYAGCPNGTGSTNLASKPEERYIQLELQDETLLSALRYLPRGAASGNMNGVVTKYRVAVSTDGSNFTDACSGDWDGTAGWKLAVFDQPTSAKYVRLYGVATYTAEGDNMYMTAREVRVVKADNRTDMSRAVVTVSPTEFQWKNVEIRPGSGSEADQGATVTVTLNGTTLVKDVDYYLTYSNNSDPGTAYIFAKAMANGNYKGTASATFTIVKNDAKILSFESITATTQAGIPPVLPDTVWANMSNGNLVAVPVIWDPVPEEYYIFPQQTSYVLQGRVEDEDLLSSPDLRPSLTVKVGWSQSVDSVPVTTAVGVLPSLPATVTVRFNDGTSGQRAVTRWYRTDLDDLSDLTKLTEDHKFDLTAADFAQPGIVKVVGDISGIDRVKAEVNVHVMAGTPTGNLALNTDSNHTTIPFPMAYRSSSDTVDNPRYLVDGERTGNVGNGKKIWCNWAEGVFDTAPWAAVALAGQLTGSSATAKTYIPETVIVNKVRIGFVEESSLTGTNTSKVMYPSDYTVQYYTGDTSNLVFNTTDNGNVRTWPNSPLNNNRNWTTVTPKTTKPSIPNSNTAWVEYEFQPVNTAILRVVLTPKPNQWVGVEELEIYGLDLTPNADFNVESVTLNGIQRLQDFQGSGSDKTLEVTLAQDAAIPQLAVRADSNAAISITQAARVPGMPEPGGAWAQAVITSEDGSKTETYTVKFTRENAPDSYDIVLNSPDLDQLTFSADGGPAGTLITVTAPTGYEMTHVLVVIKDGPREGEIVPTENGSFRMPAANVRFSATVAPIRYTITYYLNGGADEGSNRHDYNVEIPTFTLLNPTRTGYTFVGWTGTDLTSPSKTVTIQKGSIGDRTYTAVWMNNSSGNIPSGGGGGGGSSLPAGSRVTTTKDAAGNTVVTTTMPNGVVTTVTTAPDGSQTSTVKLPSAVGDKVELEMPPLATETAPTVTISASHPTIVTIPVQNISNGTIALRVNDDGSETIIPMAAVTDSGLRLAVQNGDTIKLIDNSKFFDDLAPNHWALDAVSFTAGRELFLGLNTPENFAPNEPMSRAMMVTVLWRMSEKPAAEEKHSFDDVVEGAWYDEAIQWAVEADIAQGTGDGFDPNAPVTREQLAVMLYRAAGSPDVDENAVRRIDGQKVSPWAAKAMAWCVENNILNGRDGSDLAPQDTASRAEVAAMLMRYIKTSLGIPL